MTGLHLIDTQLHFNSSGVTKGCIWYLMNGGVDWKLPVNAYPMLSKVKIHFK